MYAGREDLNNPPPPAAADEKPSVTTWRKENSSSGRAWEESGAPPDAQSEAQTLANIAQQKSVVVTPAQHIAMWQGRLRPGEGILQAAETYEHAASSRQVARWQGRSGGVRRPEERAAAADIERSRTLPPKGTAGTQTLNVH